MGREYKRLTVRAVEANAKKAKPGLYPDGDGLNQQITAAGVSSWIFRYKGSTGRERKMGLGPTRDVSLAEARELAADARRLRRSGIDPLDARRAEQRTTTTAAAKATTFKQCAAAYLAAHQTGWRNVKHREQWPLSLERYVFPVFGNVPVAEIDVGLVMKAVEPIWHKKPETASRVRQRVEAVLDYAKAREYRSGENPARWRGHLDKLLPRKSKVRRVEHHAALPYSDVAAFVADLRRRDSITARLLEFIILTGVRSGEARGARWDEIDLAEKVWTIPATRMKSGKEPHRVPLSPAALAVLERAAANRSSDYVFPGQTGGPMSTSTQIGRAHV